MSILTQGLIDHVNINGIKYSINTDYRCGIEFVELVRNEEISDTALLTKALRKFYKEQVPSDIEKAINHMIAFFFGEISEKKKPKETEPVYSYEHDANLILAAFWQQYGIDLTKETMHWHKFKALFEGLTEATEFKKVVQYRAMDITEMKGKQRAQMDKLKKIYRLPQSKKEEERISMLEEALIKGDAEAIERLTRG